MMMYELTDSERWSLVDLLKSAKVNILTVGEIDEALEILGVFEEESEDEHESCE